MLLVPLLSVGILIWCFPGYMFGKIVRDVGEDSCAFWSFFFIPVRCCVARTFIRWKLRQKQNIPVRTAMYSTHIIIVMELSCTSIDNPNDCMHAYIPPCSIIIIILL